MTVETPTREQVLSPEPEEQTHLLELHRELVEIVAKGETTARLISAEGHEVEVPASAFHALELVAEAMSQGLPIALIPQGQELTTQQAADLLHVSRPHLIGLLEEGRIPFHLVGTHRRVKIEDVLGYRSERNRRRREALQTITEIAEEAPGGYS